MCVMSKRYVLERKKKVKIYDISRELFSASVYPGDPVPNMEIILSLEKQPPDKCQLSCIQMGSHTGTHLDAPRHFLKNGNDVLGISLEKCLGKCQVVSCEGVIDESQVDEWTKGNITKILIAGNVEITPSLAHYIVEHGIDCIGVEMSTIAIGDPQVEVHQILLEGEVVILEGLSLSNVKDGRYFLCALPLKMTGADGSPVRAVLIDSPLISEN